MVRRRIRSIWRLRVQIPICPLLQTWRKNLVYTKGGKKMANSDVYLQIAEETKKKIVEIEENKGQNAKDIILQRNGFIRLVF
ncbi:hypothetical protein KKB43_04965 [Patescibacteria group bacterium]|nr:hypothetical protein [Patescibacteria group bacterium]MBU4580336.1 hypothetical protein [Patescibacteria group bacterium]